MFLTTNRKSLIYALLIAVVFLNTFLVALQLKMDKVIPSGMDRHGVNIAIAISDSVYGLKGYSAYYKVYLDLKRDGLFDRCGIMKRDDKGSEIDEYSVKANKALTNALTIKNVNANGKQYLPREYKGLTDYYKLSFRIFGYNLQGFCYLYFLILLVSAVTFFVSFYKRIDLLQFLLLFLCAHFVTVALGIQAVHDQRFLTVLSILPAFHLALLILGKNVNKRSMFIGGIIQAFILVFAIHIRGSVKYQLLFLLFFTFVTAGFFYLQNKKLGMNVFNKIRFWPLITVYFFSFLLNIHLCAAMNYPYTDTTSTFLVWDTVYISMASHPDAMKKYGIWYDDNVGYTTVEKLYPGSMSFQDIDNDLVEQVLKKECLRIMKTDTLFFVQSVLFKIPQFLNSLFVPETGYVVRFFTGINIVVIFMGAFLSCNIFLKQGGLFVFLICMELMFSSIPFLISNPMLALTAEPTLNLTFLLYVVLALFICAICTLVHKLKKKFS